MHFVFRHRFWSTLRINQSCALSEYDSLNSCTVSTIFCLPILLRKRVITAVFAGTLSMFILNCIGLFPESGCHWDIPAIYSRMRSRVSMLFSDKWIKTIAWPNGEQKAIRTAYASCIILRFVLEWHKSDTACAYLIQASWNKRHSADRVHSNSARRNNERERATLSCISSAVYIGRAWPNASIVIRCVVGAWYCMNFSIAFGFRLYRNFLCSPPRVLRGEDPSDRRCSTHVETNHERDLSRRLTTHLKFVDLD